MANRQLRVKSLIAKNVMDILTFELKNPSIGLVSVNEVDVNKDNSLAKIYVSFLGSKSPKKHVEELNRAKGFIRSSLAKKMDVYKVPDLLFIYDESFDKAKRMDELLKKEEEEIALAKKNPKI